MSSSVAPQNCLICGKDLGDQKPLLIDADGEEEVSKFKQSFRCFCKLLNFNNETLVDKILDRAVAALMGRSSLEEDAEEQVLSGFPCCVDCCGALRDILSLQRTIDEMKANQLDYVETLKTSLLSGRDVNPEENIWCQIRQQLVACILKRTTRLLQLLPTLPSVSNCVSQMSPRRLPNILRRRRTPCSSHHARNNASSISAIASQIVVPVSVEYILPNTSGGESSTAEKCYDDNDMPPTSPSSTFPIHLNPPHYNTSTKKSGRKRTQHTDMEVGSNANHSKVKPCSVVLERIPVPVKPDADSSQDDNFINNEPTQPTTQDEYTVGESMETKSTEATKRWSKMGKMFYLVDEDILLHRFTLIKVSRGATQFSCLENGCSVAFQNPEWQLLFEKMQDHIEQNHIDIKQKSDKECPVCKEEFCGITGTQFRRHILSGHSLETVVCEICWKPIRHVADTYRIHNWYHKTLKEKEECEEGPPRQLIYKAGKKSKKKMKKMALGNFRKRKFDDFDYTPKSRSPVAFKRATTKKTTVVNDKKLEAPTLESPVKSSKQTEPETMNGTVATFDEDINLGSRTRRRKSKFANLSEYVVDDGPGDADEYIPSSAAASDDDFVPDEEAHKPKRKFAPSTFLKVPPKLKEESSNQINQRDCQLKGYKRNDMFWIINDNTLLYQFTLIQVSHGRTQFTCLEENCSVVIQDLEYSSLFEKMKEHVQTYHIPAINLKPAGSCPHSNCQAGFPTPKHFRSHFFKVHSVEKVVCEICWKPIRKVADSYQRHKYFHRSEQEKCEVPPPRQLVYKAMKASGKGSGRNIKLLEKLGILTRNENKDIIKSPKFRRTDSHTLTKDDCIFQIRDDLYLYKYTLIKGIPEGFSCQEPDCSTVIPRGTDWYAAFEDAKKHVNNCHIFNSDENNQQYITKLRQCPTCPEDQQESREGFLFRRHLLSGDHPSSCYACQSCLKTYRNRPALEWHMWNHKSAEEKESSNGGKRPEKTYFPLVSSEFNCNECGKQFNSKTSLQAHSITHLPMNCRKQFDCTYCPAKLLGRPALRNHIERLHRPDLKRVRNCPICNQQFNVRDGFRYRVHIATHKNERPYVCEICGVSFNAPDRFRKHRKKVHSDERSYQCEFCEMSYKFYGSWKRHRESAHSDKVHVPDPEEKLKLTQYRHRPDFIGPKIMFPCEICEKVFALRSRMTKHIRICHDGESLKKQE